MFGWMKQAPRRAAGGKRAYESNTIVLIDTSSSVGQDMVDFAAKKGLPAIAASMRSASARTGIVYNLGVMTFASQVETVIPLTNVRKLDVERALPALESRGVTRMEDAMWEALAEIDKEKARQDRERIPRAGSLVVIVTDGCPTDEDGKRSKLSDYLVRELESRNRTRSCETFAIGMGDVDDATLGQLGPATSQVADGGKVEVPHAVRYLGEQQDVECWRMVYQLIGEASSSATGKRSLAYTDDQSAWTRHVDTIRIDPDAFRIVV